MRHLGKLVLFVLGALGPALAEAQLGSWHETVDMLSGSRTGHTATLLSSGKVLVAGGEVGGIPSDKVDLFDPATGSFDVAGHLIHARTNHAATLLASGKVLVVGGEIDNGVLASVEIFDPATGIWVSSPSTSGECPSPPAGFGAPCALATARASHTVTLLSSGEALVVGGLDASKDPLVTAETYRPETGIWHPVEALSVARSHHTATLLPSGRVLVTGGDGNNGDDGELASVVIYDPATEAWISSPADDECPGDPGPDAPCPLTVAREKHTATLLPSGKVLITGGSCDRTTELYDPSSGKFAPGPLLDVTHKNYAATLLPSGEVLVSGGRRCNGTELMTAMIFNEVASSWTPAAELLGVRKDHTATLLPSGKVLVVGGGTGDGPLASAEIFDPLANTIAGEDAVDFSDQRHTATLMPDGRVLVVGGGDGDEGVLASVKIYNPSSDPSDPWVSSPPGDGECPAMPGIDAPCALGTSRRSHTATLLPSGKVLVVGGDDGQSGKRASVEIYDPGNGTWVSSPAGDGECPEMPGPDAPCALGTARRGHTATLLPSGKVLVAGGEGADSTELEASEIYDPMTGGWQQVAPMTFAHERHTATLLLSGMVLVVGGQSNGADFQDRVEIYDPVNNLWLPAAPLLDALRYHTATLLPSGKVLVAGGERVGPVENAEIYDPASDSWQFAASLTNEHTRHAATLLPSGEVLVSSGGSSEGSLESYDPATGAWMVIGSATVGPRHTATLLPSGVVLLVGNGKWRLVDPNFPDARRPDITEVLPLGEDDLSVLDYASDIEITGTGLGGDSEASGGATNASPANLPLVQLRAVEGDLVSWLEPDSLPIFCPVNPDSEAALGFCDDQEAVLTVSEVPPIFNPGWHLLTVFTAGVPSDSKLVKFRCSLKIAQFGQTDPVNEEGEPLDVMVGEKAIFSVETRGGRSFQWQKCLGDATTCDDGLPGGPGWIEIPGAHETSYTTPLIDGPESGTRYRVVVDSGCTSEASVAAVLTVADDVRPTTEVVSPSGGEFWLLSQPDVASNTEVVTWSMSDNVRICQVDVSLRYSDDGGVTFEDAPDGVGLPADFGPGGTCTSPEATTSLEYTVPESPPSGSAGSLYKIRVTVTDHAGNTTVAESPSPFFIVQPNENSFETLILGNTGRMAAKMGITPAEAVNLEARLKELAAHPRVQGRVIDLGLVTDLTDLYAAWDADPADPELANQVLFGSVDRGGIHQYLLDELLPIFTGVRYLVLVGDDRIIPLARLPDRTRLLPESSYPAGGELTTASTVGQALAADQYLSDDPLAVRDPVAPADLPVNLFVPDLAVGRLVENPAEIITTIATFISQDGILDLTAAANLDHQVLVTGYDFLVDSARTIQRRWQGALVPSDPFGGAPEPVNGVLVGSSWPLSPSASSEQQELLEHLGGQLGDVTGGSDGARFGVMSLSGHATHFEAGVPGDDDRFTIEGLATCAIEADDLACPAVPAAPLDLAGGVIYAVGCHSGLPVPDLICQPTEKGCDEQNPCDPVTNPPCDPDNSLDLPQTFLSRGALAYVANTGYGFGFVHGIAYGERLVEILTERLAVGGTVMVGEAVKATKQQYFQETQVLDPYDQKSLMQWTFFGLPMVALRTGIVEAEAGGPGLAPPFSVPAPRAEELAAVERLGEVTVYRQLSGAAAGSSGASATKGGAPLPPFLTRLDLQFEFPVDSAYLKRTASGEICCPAGICPGDDVPDCDEDGCAPGFVECPVAGCDDPDGCYYTLNGLVEGRASGVVDWPLQPYLLYDSRLAGTSQHGVLWKGGVYREESGWKPVFGQVASNEIEADQADDPGVLVRVATICPTALRLVPGADPAECRPSDSELNSLVINAGEAVDSDGIDGDGDGKFEYDLERVYPEIELEAFYFNDTLVPLNNCDRAGPQFADGPYHEVVSGTTIEWAVAVSDDDSEVWRVVVVWDDGTVDTGGGRCGAPIQEPPAAERCWTPLDLEDDGNGTFRGSVVVAAGSRVNYLLQAVDTRGNVSALPFQITDLTGAPCSCAGEPDACPEPGEDEPPICAESGVVPQLPQVIDVEVDPVADLSITKQASIDPATAGAELTYTLTVANVTAGSSDADGVIVTDDLPPGVSFVTSSDCDGDPGGSVSCRLGTIPHGTSREVSITARVDSATTGTLINQASVSATTADPGLADNQTSVATAVTTSADLEISLSAPSTVLAGGELAYDVTVANHGPSDATGVEVIATLPELLSGTWSDGCVNDPDGSPVCALGTIVADTSRSYTYTLTGTVDPGATGALVGSASVFAGVSDPQVANNTASTTTVVDLAPPTVLGIGSVADTGDGVLEDCETTRVVVRRLLVTFSEAMRDPEGDAGNDDVTNPENYRLLAAGPDRDFQTEICGPALGDDAEVALAAIIYDAANRTATLAVDGNTLTDDLYRLIACGSTTLRDLAGHALDGDGDGSDGDDFQLTFRVDRANLFANGRFDCSLAGWGLESTEPGEIAYGPEDADGAAVSGSARVTNLSDGRLYALGQCLPIETGDLALAARWRLATEPRFELGFTAGCDFYPEPACAGEALLPSRVSILLADSGGVWQLLEHTLALPTGAVSALCGFEVERPEDAGFTLSLDDLVLSGSIFTDGFESGDTSIWSVTVGD